MIIHALSQLTTFRARPLREAVTAGDILLVGVFLVRKDVLHALRRSVAGNATLNAHPESARNWQTRPNISVSLEDEPINPMPRNCYSVSLDGKLARLAPFRIGDSLDWITLQFLSLHAR